MPDAVFTEAPEEVTRYFDAKGQHPSFDWRDTAPHEHAVSFTVAKSAGFDILDDIRDATTDAIRNYKSYGDFIDELEPTLRKKGWWGRQAVKDPITGKITYAQLGSLRRLRTIYWANVNTARAAGEWERIQRTKRGLPFLVYELSVAEKKRPEHMAWVGIILPVDDPFWQTHYPPNGWLCKCRVRQISRREAERLGYDPTTGGPQIVTRPWTNRRTGERIDVPKGIDPGWHTNPGVTRAANVNQFLTDRLDALPSVSRNVAVKDLVGARPFRALAGGDLPYTGAADRSPANIERGRMALPVAVLPESLVKELGAKTRIVMFSNADAHKQIKKRVSKSGAQQFDAPDYHLVQQLVEEGTLYQEQTAERDVIIQGVIEGKGWHIVIRKTTSGEAIFLKSFRRIAIERIGGDRLIEM